MDLVEDEAEDKIKAIFKDFLTTVTPSSVSSPEERSPQLYTVPQGPLDPPCPCASLKTRLSGRTPMSMQGAAEPIEGARTRCDRRFPGGEGGSSAHYEPAEPVGGHSSLDVTQGSAIATSPRLHATTHDRPV